MNTTHVGAIMIRGKGTGFVAHPDLEEDIVVEREALGFALDGDIVEVELKKKVPGKRQEGKVLRVVKAVHRTPAVSALDDDAPIRAGPFARETHRRAQIRL